MDPWDGPLPLGLADDDPWVCIAITANTMFMFAPCLPLGAAMFAAEPMCRDNTLYCVCGAPWDILTLAPLSLFGIGAFAVRGCKRAPIREVRTALELQMGEGRRQNTQTVAPPAVVASA